MNKYIITDPCYLLDDKTWQKCCHDASGPKVDDWNDKTFSERVSNELKKLSGDPKAIAAGTGYGDWCNKIDYYNRTHVTVEQSEFAADSGMVCICKINDAIQKIVDENANSSLYAIFSTDKDIDYKIEEDDNWSIVSVYSESTLIIATLEDGYDDEDDEYDWDDDEDQDY